VGNTGQRAWIEHREAPRDGYWHEYLDAVEAGPFLLSDRKRAVPPDDLYARMKPFQDVGAEDIREGGGE
jgi:hypothetical protein